MDDELCPFCVEGDAFKVMTGHVDGRFICARCGHVVWTASSYFQCNCLNCRQLNRPGENIPQKKPSVPKENLTSQARGS